MTKFWPTALLVLLLAGCKEKKPVATLDFAAYGDCRHNTGVHRRIAGSIAATGAKFTMVTGDLVEAAGDPAAWAEFRDIVKELRKKPYDCAVGDHDPDEKANFKKELGLDRLYYDRKDGDFHIFVLDSCGKFTDKDQLDWLEKTASASTAKHKFAVFHHPPFAIKSHRVAEAEEIRPRIHPLLVKLKFCAAFCGHQHGFYSVQRDGLRYIVTAGGGAPLYNVDTALLQPGDLHKKFFHFVGCTVAGNKIIANVYDPDGREEEGLMFTVCEHP
jgi:hypothetical protein